MILRACRCRIQRFQRKIRSRKKSKAKDAEKFLTMKDVPAPHQIKAQLDAYVIGQERAKRAVSVAVYNHYKRVILRQQDELRANENTEEKAENAAARECRCRAASRRLRNPTS